jgi:hypothetical protein
MGTSGVRWTRSLRESRADAKSPFAPRAGTGRKADEVTTT